jgi:hypothetical protein
MSKQLFHNLKSVGILVDGARIRIDIPVPNKATGEVEFARLPADQWRLQIQAQAQELLDYYAAEERLKTYEIPAGEAVDLLRALPVDRIVMVGILTQGDSDA